MCGPPGSCLSWASRWRLEKCANKPTSWFKIAFKYRWDNAALVFLQMARCMRPIWTAVLTSQIPQTHLFMGLGLHCFSIKFTCVSREGSTMLQRWYTSHDVTRSQPSYSQFDYETWTGPSGSVNKRRSWTIITWTIKAFKKKYSHSLWAALNCTYICNAGYNFPDFYEYNEKMCHRNSSADTLAFFFIDTVGL